MRVRSRRHSLSVSDAFKTFVLDQLEELGEVVPKSMFGGIGLYRRGIFFGIIARGVLYLKVKVGAQVDHRRQRPMRIDRHLAEVSLGLSQARDALSSVCAPRADTGGLR